MDRSKQFLQLGGLEQDEIQVPPSAGALSLPITVLASD
jgi:hypothetical protein